MDGTTSLPEPIRLDDSATGANMSKWFDWPLEMIQLDGSTWLQNPIHLMAQLCRRSQCLNGST